MADNFIKAEIGRIFKQIAKWKSFVIRAWHIGDEHIHLVIDIPPKFSVAYAVQVLKGKSSSWLKKKVKKNTQRTILGKRVFCFNSWS